MKLLTTIFTTFFFSLGVIQHFSADRSANHLQASPSHPCSCEQHFSGSAESKSLEFDQRQEIESEILRSTARLVIQTWEMADNEAGYIVHEGSGHATIKDGRYLVTHNHFEVPFSIGPEADESAYYTRFLVFDAFGNLKYEGPASEFFIAAQEAEVLVFGHQEINFFNTLGFTSAEFISWDQIERGDKGVVAQVDWDGEHTRIDWVTLGDLMMEDGVPQSFLADGALRGASGGGIFWQGQHIGNNWAVRQVLDSRGNVLSERTRVALNTDQIAGV